MEKSLKEALAKFDKNEDKKEVVDVPLIKGFYDYTMYFELDYNSQSMSLKVTI